MNKENGGKFQPTATLDYAVVKPSLGRAREIWEDDWNRIRRAVGQIRPAGGVYLSLASIAVGLLVSAAAVWLSFKYSSPSVPQWAWTSDITVFWCAGLLSLALFIFHCQERGTANRSVESVLDEMAEIDRKYETPASHH